jgi:flavin reductase (DIM6/NTAB) family NADH-FMN oxidoreductase RutF
MQYKSWNQVEIEQLERRHRANLINSIEGFKSLVLVGTKSPQGNTNLATFNSLFHLGADPALCGIIMRPNEEGENTLGNILFTKYFTLNHVRTSFYQQAHQCSAKYPSGVSEFGHVGLTEQWRNDFFAPFVQESIIKMGCELVESVYIRQNGTTFIIGKFIYLEAPQECILDDGSIDLEKAESVTCSGLDTYYTTQLLGKLAYAKYNP